MTPRIIDLPGVQVPNTVTVDRRVLATVLRFAAIGARATENCKDRFEVFAKLSDEVGDGARVTLALAEWREIGGND